MQGELKTFETVLLKCDKPYASGRIYPKEVVDQAIEKFNKDMAILYVEDTTGADCETVDMSQIIGIIKDVHIDKRGVVGTVTLLDTPNGRLFRDKNIDIHLSGIGDVDHETNKVTDYTIIKAIAGGKK